MTNRALIAEDLTLDVIETLCWELLRAGAESTSGALRFPVLATNTGDGVDARVLVLRRVDKPLRALEFHTDMRSAKIEQIRSNPDMNWVFYDPAHKLQLRARGRGSVCTDSEVIDSRWVTLSSHTQRAYAQELAPGTRVDRIQNGAPCAHLQNPQSGKTNFAVVTCIVDELEWLLLSRNGHQRAVVSFNEGGWSSSWIMP